MVRSNCSAPLIELLAAEGAGRKVGCKCDSNTYYMAADLYPVPGQPYICTYMEGDHPATAAPPSGFSQLLRRLNSTLCSSCIDNRLSVKFIVLALNKAKTRGARGGICITYPGNEPCMVMH